MTPSKVRIALRWIHIVLGLILMGYIYSPFNKFRAFQLAVKILVIPMITFTGLWVWKFKTFNRILGIKDS